MKKLVLKITVFLGIFFFLSSCAKTTNNTWVILKEEGCLPPWVSLKNDAKSRNNLSSLLKGDGIIPLKIKITGERDATCITCDCETGKVYRVQIDDSQLNRIYYYGFSSE